MTGTTAGLTGNGICDVAHWFDPAFVRTVSQELERPLLFARKQWEFARMLLALEAAGLLREDTRCLSLGSGMERMLYTLARRVGLVWATDLYTADTGWDTARTDDPEGFVAAFAPFPIPPGRLKARHMDMRQIDFPDESFDCAYSACAIEHIGSDDDFRRHLAEVYRVLRPGGVYALSTELTYDEASLRNPGNTFFAIGHLEELVRGSGFSCDSGFDWTLSPHAVNDPYPANLPRMVNPGGGPFQDYLFFALNHLHLLIGDVAYTSCVLVLHKGGDPFTGWRHRGREAACARMATGVAAAHDLVERTTLVPQLSGRGGVPVLGHPEAVLRPGDGPFAQTDYMNLGRRPRTVVVDLVLSSPPVPGTVVDVVVNTLAVREPWVITPHAACPMALTGRHIRVTVPIFPEPSRQYAVALSWRGSPAPMDEVRVTIHPTG